MASNYKNKIMNHLTVFKSYFIKHYLKFVSFALLTLPAAILKQILVYKAGLDVKPSIMNTILDVLCLRTGWGIENEFPYNSPLWFIHVLLIMYLLYYFVCWITSGSNTRYIMACWFIFILGLVLLFNRNIYFFTIQEISARGYCNFFIGCLLYEIYIKTINKDAVINRYNFLFVMFLAIDVIVYLSGHTTIWGDFRVVYMFLLWPSLIWVSLHLKWLERVFTVKPLLNLGKVSNSIFIWHHPVLYIIYPLVYMGKLKIELGAIGPFCIIILLVIIISFISNRIFESKILVILMSFVGKSS